MLLKTIADGRALLSSIQRVPTGVGMTAYSRIAPASLFSPYFILCLRKTKDLHLLRERAEVFCLEEETGGLIREKGINSESLLRHPRTRAFLRGLPGPKCLLLYQSYPGLETLAAEEGWELLANPASLRMELNSRAFFRKMIRDLGLPELRGGIYPLEKLLKGGYRDWAGKLGEAFVIQLPEIGQGGGKGTFFVRSREEFDSLCSRLGEGVWRGTRLSSFSAHRFVRGRTISTALCLTRHGVLISGPQKQLTDLTYCRGLPERGIFCGHVWGEAPCPEHLRERVRSQAGRIGGHLGSTGYKGILGIDFIIDEVLEEVYPLEINPRFTGAFPMLSELHTARGILPMELFHILEFLDVPYQIDTEEMNRDYEEAVKGGHLLVFLLSERKGVKAGSPAGGLYFFDPELNSCTYKGASLDYRDLEDENHFILADGPPDTGGEDFFPSEPLYRLCRILLRPPVADSTGDLLPRVKSLMDWVYENIVKEKE